jgi:hypothetical protein
LDVSLEYNIPQWKEMVHTARGSKHVGNATASEFTDDLTLWHGLIYGVQHKLTKAASDSCEGSLTTVRFTRLRGCCLVHQGTKFHVKYHTSLKGSRIVLMQVCGCFSHYKIGTLNKPSIPRQRRQFLLSPASFRVYSSCVLVDSSWCRSGFAFCIFDAPIGEIRQSLK